MRKIITKISVVLLTLVLLSFCACEGSTTGLAYIKNKSTFMDFQLKDNDAYFYCDITVKNNGSSEKSFTITGDFEQDYENGLISEEKLVAKDKKSSDQVFTLKPNEQKTFEVVFNSDLGGKTNNKSHRTLPSISINNA